MSILKLYLLGVKSQASANLVSIMGLIPANFQRSLPDLFNLILLECY